MPSVDQTGNSVITAIVTGSRANALKLADFYGIEHVFGYDQYEEMLGAGVVDAVYIALPNSMHADYAIRAANAGVHVLLKALGDVSRGMRGHDRRCRSVGGQIDDRIPPSLRTGDC